MDSFQKDVQRLHEFMAGHLTIAPWEQDMSVRLEISFLCGCYMVVNAIEDIRLVIEGPDCTYMKQQFLMGNHDLMSTLQSATGFHRVITSDVHVDRMHEDREGALIELLHKVASLDSTAAVMISTMPMALITGADYDRLCRMVSEHTGTPTLAVRGLSLQGDWMDGFAEMLLTFAKSMDLPEVTERGDPEDVAIVGYLYDRHEQDHQANLAELHEIFEALGLNLRCIWLSGQSYGDLQEIAGCGTVIALPYAKKAAKIVARRVKAKVLNMALPFGLTATEAFVRELGRTFGREEEAERYIDGKLREIVPRLEWIIPLVFQNASIGYVGDPVLAAGFLEILGLLGANLAFGILTNRPKHARLLGAAVQERGMLVYPRQKAFLRHVNETFAREPVHLVVGNCQAQNIITHEVGFMEFGFPMVYTHALFDRPFLGFRGFMAFVSEMANAMRKAELEAARAQGLRMQLAAMKEYEEKERSADPNAEPEAECPDESPSPEAANAPAPPVRSATG